MYQALAQPFFDLLRERNPRHAPKQLGRNFAETEVKKGHIGVAMLETKA
jgi:hypothetical protein